MNEFLKRLELLCKERGISKRKLEELAGLGVGSTSKWKTKEPSQRSLQRLSAFFNVSISWLIGESQSRVKSDPLPFEVVSDQSIRIRAGLRVPVLDYLPADGLVHFQDAVSWVDIGEPSDGSVFGYVIPDQALAPRICQGDVVLIKLTGDSSPGDLTMICIDSSEPTLRHTYFCTDGTIVTGSVSDQPLFLPSQSVRVLGVAFEVRRKL